MMPVSSWRSVGASQNGFFHESIVDEMAFAADRDPFEFRFDMLNDEVSRGVLSVGAYGLVIWAMSLTPMTYVSALRETSVLIAAAIGSLFLKEPMTLTRPPSVIPGARGAFSRGTRPRG